MKIYQNAELSADPQNDMDATTKRYVDQKVISGAIVGGVFFTNIAPTSTGIVGSKQYVPNTVPANKVITDGITDTANVRISLVAEGGSAFYSPTITITTVPVLPGTPMQVPLTEDTYDKRMFAGQVDLTGVTADTIVTASSSTNAVAVCTVKRAAAGPTVSAATFGGYPGTQTEAKSGDVITITGVVANSAMYVEVATGGASAATTSLTTIGATDSAGAGFRTFSGSMTVSSGTGVQTAVVRARNTLGTFGADFTTSNSITLNQTAPTIGARTIAYPAGQTALKGNESATVTATITNFDTVVYSTGATLTVDASTTYAAAKTITRASGTYATANNYTITATKASNGAVTTATAAVVIADAAATAAISITGTPSRLISSAAGQNYVVNVTPSQVLASAPDLTAPSGTWSGSWTLTGNIWSRTLVIADTDVKGAQTFGPIVLTGKAGVVGSSITAGATYTVGGFAQRTLTVPAFAQIVAIGTNVTTVAKVTARYAGSGDNLVLQASTANVANGFTIVDADGTYNPTGAYLFITDATYAGANTSGTLQVEIGEAA